jgi:glutathione S-transferase
MAARLKLYHWEPVTECAKVMICLHELGLEFGSEYVDILEFKQFSKKFLGMNPGGQVPVLVYGKEAISESTLINEFLTEAFPGKNLAPTDPKGWYETQCWGKYLDYNLGPSVATLGWHATMMPLMKARDAKKLQKSIGKIPVRERQAAWAAAVGDAYTPEQLADSRRKIELAMKRIESTLAGSAWLMGEDYSIIDINAFALASTLPRLTPEIVNQKATPHTMKWLDRIAARPAVKQALAMRSMTEPQDIYAPGPEHSRWG